MNQQRHNGIDSSSGKLIVPVAFQPVIDEAPSMLVDDIAGDTYWHGLGQNSMDDLNSALEVINKDPQAAAQQ